MNLPKVRLSFIVPWASKKNNCWPIKIFGHRTRREDSFKITPSKYSFLHPSKCQKTSQGTAWKEGLFCLPFSFWSPYISDPESGPNWPRGKPGVVPYLAVGYSIKDGVDLIWIVDFYNNWMWADDLVKLKHIGDFRCHKLVELPEERNAM